MTASGAPFVWMPRPASWSTVLISLSVGSKWKSARRMPGCARRRSVPRRASRRCRAARPRLGRHLCGRRPPVERWNREPSPGSSVRAVPSRRSAGVFWRLLAVEGPQSRHAACGSRSACPSCPYRSRQSSRGSRPREALDDRADDVPGRGLRLSTASVMTGSRPSGTLPTMSPTAKTTAFETGRPVERGQGTKAVAMITAIAAMSQATRRTWCSSGLSSVSTLSDNAA